MSGLGPVLGGFVAETKGWRWLEWVIVFFTLTAYLYAMFISETSKKIILSRRARRIGLTGRKAECAIETQTTRMATGYVDKAAGYADHGTYSPLFQSLRCVKFRNSLLFLCCCAVRFQVGLRF